MESNPTGHEATIAALETQLHEKDNRLRESQAALLAAGRKAGSSGLDDRSVHDKFARLSKSINDWVVTHFKTLPSGTMANADVIAKAEHSQPNYAKLLQEPRTKFLVLRGLVADAIFQAFNSGKLLGNSFLEIKHTIEAHCESQPRASVET